MYYSTRAAALADIPAITKIYNQGIEDRIATLESTIKTEEDRREWLLGRSERHKVLVLERERDILGWASLNVFNGRCCYGGVVDFSIYIRRDVRGKGFGKILLNALIETAAKEGFHKLVLSALNDNQAGKKLYRSTGFREVGVYERQGILDGQWKDIVLMEKLLI